VGDLERQGAVEQATGGCVLAVVALALIKAAVALLVWSSMATPILGTLLLVGGLGLAVMAWTERG
jgi:hypothetical protein